MKSLDGYLFIITRNTIFNYNRRSFNEESFEMTVLNSMEEGEPFTVEDELMASDLKKFIDDLIEQMPPQRKKIFQMSREEGLSNKEIAERLDITVKAVERSITLSLKFLRDSLIMFMVFEGFC
jgi:RNA polymerase sigma-70 factor (ECF subfamily)